MKNNDFSFELITQSDNARLGKISTSKGEIDTPAFMPVGTQGTVKGIYTDDILKTGTQIILGNTYHLLLRPGIEILKKFNGLHKFMNWNKPILTDSGGYQIMSLSNLNKIDKNIGAVFKSHIDGKKIILSPEKSIQVQKAINSDIIMVLDECPKLTNDKKALSKAIDVSSHWAKRSKIEFGMDNSKGLFISYNKLHDEYVGPFMAIKWRGRFMALECGYFYGNVMAKYEGSELFAEKAEYSNSKSYLMISNNVKVKDYRGTMFADKLLFDIKKQTLNIASTKDGKVNANINLK